MQSAGQSDMKAFFEPEAVAVIGSLKENGGLAYVAIQNMLRFGYAGRAYPVNPSYTEAHGFKAYASIGEVGQPVDLAIVITPPPTVPGIVEECARAGVKAVLVVSENFGEAGGEGMKLQQRLAEVGRRTGIRIMGPNTIGLMNTSNGFITVPYYIAYDRVQKGGIAFCSQSGFVGPTAQPLKERAYPIARMCDVGNKCDVNEVDLLDYLADVPEAKVVAMHLEDVKDGRRFMEAARRLVRRKPLLILKSGRSEAGARASASHTSSLAGNEKVYDAAFRQVGAFRVNTWHEFWEIPRFFASQPLPKGNRIGIVTHTGGAGVVATDVAVEAGLTIAKFTEKTLKRLYDFSPRLVTNPCDMGPILSIVDNPFYVQEEGTVAIVEDPNVDCAAIATYGMEQIVEPIVAMFVRLKQRTSKPFVVWIYGMQLTAMEEMVRQLEANGIPAYLDFETAVKALGIAARYAAMRRELDRTEA